MENIYESKYSLKRKINLENLKDLTQNLEKKLNKDFIIKKQGSNKYLQYSANFLYNNGIPNAQISLKILNSSDMSESPCAYNPLLNRNPKDSRKQLYIESSAMIYSKDQNQEWCDVFKKFIKTVEDLINK